MAIIVKNYVVDTYEDDLEMGEIGNTCACWGNSAVPVSGTFNTAREALDAVLRKNLFSNQTIASATWTAIDRPVDGGDSVEYRTHFVSRACGVKDVYTVYASISKATFTAPSKADEKGLAGKAIRA